MLKGFGIIPGSILGPIIDNKKTKEEMEEAKRKDFEKQTGIKQESNKLRNYEAMEYLLKNYDGYCGVEFEPLTKQYIIKIKSKILLIDEWYVRDEYKKMKFFEIMLKFKKDFIIFNKKEDEHLYY